MPPSKSPRTLAAAVACLALATAGSAAAATQSVTGLALHDIAGDANAMNDQGEGLVGNVRTGRQIDQADLRTVTVAALPGRSARQPVLRVSFTTTAKPAALPDGTPLAYGVLLVPARDCRITVEYVTARTSGIGKPGAATGVLTHTCGDGHHHTETVLPARLIGRTATVDVPRRLLPAAARFAKRLHDGAAYVRTVPVRGSAARTLELDSAR